MMQVKGAPVVVILLVAISLIASSPLSAQGLPDGSRFISNPALVLEGSDSTPQEDREAEFRSINAEVDLLQRQFSLLKRVVRFASPSIVHIEASKASQAGPGFASSKIQEAGAGVIVSLGNANYVITNRHVIHQAQLEAIKLSLTDGRLFHPERIWSDPSTDIAVLLLPSAEDIVPARIGNSNEVDIGDFVLAVGSPFGLSHSVSYGIISAKGRRNLELGAREIEIQDFFQTDAAVNPGNSGGPLLNLRGELIGINTAIVGDSYRGISFSIPSNVAKTVYEKLLASGLVQRGWLGVRLADYVEDDPELKETRTGLGALVSGIPLDGESPALKAGIQVGDRIVEFNGAQVPDHMTLKRLIGESGPSSAVKVVVIRDGERLELDVVLGARPDDGF